MPSQRQIAKDWGVSPGYVAQCAKRGCPNDTFENAREWRKAHTNMRASTSPAQLAKQLEEEKEDDSPQARERRREYYRDKPDGAHLPKQTDLQEALYNSAKAADEAWRLLSESMIDGKTSKISILLSVHTKAVEARFSAETAYREEMERRRILIPLNEAQDMARRGFDIVLSRLYALPQNTAPRCNPTDPHRAMDILQDECTTIIADAQKAFA